MNQISASPWSPMVSGPEEEFASFLEFDLQLSYPFEGGHQDGRDLQQEPDSGMDTSMGNGAGVVRLENGPVQQHMDHCNSIVTMNGFHGPPEPFHDINVPGELFNQHQQPHLHMHGPQYSGQNIIPPTPTSIEMHGEPARYYQSRDHHAQAIYDRFGRHPKDQMIFTPLVSPAVTPLDNHFPYPEYAVPGEYLSPLTSPALEAQKHAHQHSIYGAVPRSDTSEATSPIEMNIDFSAPVPIPTSSVRKSKRRTTSTSKAGSRTVRQSPSMKPQSRKKHSTSTAIPAKEVSGVIEDAQSSKTLTNKKSANGTNFSLSQSQESSEAGSISPEPLSEILMPPPATPRSSSSSRSPYLLAKQSGPSTALVDACSGEPATPASLMKIRKEAAEGIDSDPRTPNVQGQKSKDTGTEQVMNDIVSPAPANVATKPVLPPIITSNTNKNEIAPAGYARKHSKNAHFSAPATATKPFFQSPQIHGMTSPANSISARKGEIKSSGRESKKRSSNACNNSVQVSPALRPKVSPSIKPLLPECAIVNAETSALLLASKSNYQNILEGTHLPGVSYPEALSTNLTSKRTSHKIAEQGRRNRINTALQEIASLLPASTAPSSEKNNPYNKDTGPGNKPSISTTIIMTGTAAQQSNSKASTVEMAIEYIKSLQSELKDVKGRLETAERKLDEKGKA